MDGEHSLGDFNLDSEDEEEEDEDEERYNDPIDDDDEEIPTIKLSNSSIPGLISRAWEMRLT